ncbi:MAG: acyltransferase [Campylobacterales bacterium]|nr:acyltransferase [Campylobacterales bacterium]
MKTYIFQSYLQSLARNKGATIGRNCYIHPGLLKKANSNLSVGCDTIINSDKFDLRCKIKIGNNVIINSGVKIITASHNHNSIEYETTYKEVALQDYCWIATGATLLPGSEVGYGAIVGAESVIRGRVQDMSIMIGNPAVEVKKRLNVHSNLVTSSLQGMDFEYYVQARKS